MSCLSFFIPICHSLCSFSVNNFRCFYPSSSLNPEKDKTLAQTVIDLRKEIGVKKDIAVFKDASKYKFFFMARGFSFYKPFVMVPHHFFNQNPFAAKWFLRHEIAHIKNLDTIIIPTIGLIIGLAAAIFTTYFAINWFFAWPLIFLITHVSGILISRSCEKKADDLANLGASTEELQQALLVFEGFKKINLYIKAKWCPLTISQEGEDRLIFSHPSISSECKKSKKH
jgi:hypothetical protein